MKDLSSEPSITVISERELIQRAINQTSSIHKDKVTIGTHKPVPRWVVVRNLFACGSSQADAICRKYGYDPDGMIEK